LVEQRWSSMAAVAAGTAGIDDRDKVNCGSIGWAGDRLLRGPVRRPLAPTRATARRATASLRADYRKMEQDRCKNCLLPQKKARQRKDVDERNETAASGLGIQYAYGCM
jgi:hypothetical protein